LNNTIDEQFTNFDVCIPKNELIMADRFMSHSQRQIRLHGENWFSKQNNTLQKKEGKDTKWEVSSEVRKMGRGQNTNFSNG